MIHYPRLLRLLLTRSPTVCTSYRNHGLGPKPPFSVTTAFGALPAARSGPRGAASQLRGPRGQARPSRGAGRESWCAAGSRSLRAPAPSPAPANFARSAAPPSLLDLAARLPRGDPGARALRRRGAAGPARRHCRPAPSGGDRGASRRRRGRRPLVPPAARTNY